MGRLLTECPPVGPGHRLLLLGRLLLGCLPPERRALLRLPSLGRSLLGRQPFTKHRIS